jgi:hypothetical protein
LGQCVPFFAALQVAEDLVKASVAVSTALALLTVTLVLLIIGQVVPTL